MIELLNVPEPVPLEVFVLNAMVGVVLVLQQTPREVMVEPPMSVIFPPQLAEDA